AEVGVGGAAGERALFLLLGVVLLDALLGGVAALGDDVADSDDLDAGFAEEAAEVAAAHRADADEAEGDALAGGGPGGGAAGDGEGGGESGGGGAQELAAGERVRHGESPGAGVGTE